MNDQIARVANALSVGASVEDIHDVLQSEGMSEYDIFLTYIAGKLLLKGREEMPPPPAPKVRRVA